MIGQKIALGIEIEPYFTEEAKKRMQIRKGNQPGSSKENVPYLSEGQSRDQAARAAGNPACIDSVECPTFNDLVRGNTYLYPKILWSMAVYNTI